MASYRLISGTAAEINQQLTLLSAGNRDREGKGPAWRPILMSSTATVTHQGVAHVTLYVVAEMD